MSRLPMKAVRIHYRNWRGELAMRWVVPISIRYGKTEWRPEKCWLLEAKCCDKKEVREFALESCDFADHRDG